MTITLEQAHEKAERMLRDLDDSKHQFVIQDELTEERPFGWVFHPATRRYVETKDTRYTVPGVGMIAVERASGEATFLTTSVYPAGAIAEFEAEWRERTGQT